MNKKEIRSNLVRSLYTRSISMQEDYFNNLQGPRVYDIITEADERMIKDIVTDPELNMHNSKKIQYIKDTVRSRGLVRLAGGTNRIAFRHTECNDFVFKIGFDRASMNDSPSEYMNQNLIAPYVTKVFDYSRTGLIGSFERVKPMTSVQQFMQYYQEIYLILYTIIGDYVMEDIGASKFKNWGIREGFGPVLLDFPWIYPLDGNKLFCNHVDALTHKVCHGIIDYDDSFDTLSCTKCGKIYLAIDLKSDEQINKLIKKKETKSEVKDMNITVKVNGKKIVRNVSDGVTNFAALKEASKSKKQNNQAYGYVSSLAELRRIKQKHWVVLDENGEPIPEDQLEQQQPAREEPKQQAKENADQYYLKQEKVETPQQSTSYTVPVQENYQEPVEGNYTSNSYDYDDYNRDNSYSKFPASKKNKKQFKSKKKPPFQATTTYDEDKYAGVKMDGSDVAEGGADALASQMLLDEINKEAEEFEKLKEEMEEF